MFTLKTKTMINEQELKVAIAQLIFNEKHHIPSRGAHVVMEDIMELFKAHLAKYEPPLPIHDLSDAD